MLAGIPEFREDDLSHLYLRVINGNLPDAEPVHRSSFRYVLIGCAVSIVLHALVLAFYWKQDSQLVQQTVSPPLTIQLIRKPREITAIETLSASPVVMQPAEKTPEIHESPQLTNLLATEPQVQNKKEEKSIVIQPLTMDELRELNQQENTLLDEPATGIATNVFNPALRRRLNEEASKPGLLRADSGPKTHTDPSGATVVDLGGGKCLRSSVPKLGEAQNWYMTSCGGKSESEQIMDRVNQAVNGKLKFE